VRGWQGQSDETRAMKLTGVELVRVEIPFRHDIGTAAGVHHNRSLLFVRVETTDGDGWGECTAMSGATLVDPSVDQVAPVLEERGVRRLLDASRARGGHLPSGNEIAPLFGTSPIDRMVGAVFEMAVLDAECRLAMHSLADSLGVGADVATMPVGAAVGIPTERDVGPWREDVARLVALGPARLRLKIAPGWDIEPVRAVRQQHPDLTVQVDANGSYRLDADPADRNAAIRLGALAEFDVRCVEQPLPPGDLVAHAELARRIDVPICLDESLTSPRRVLDAVRNQSCAVACLKPGRLGGIGATRQAHAVCRDAGVAVFVGGFFEAGLGRAANLALAAHLAQSAAGLVGDLDAPSSYLEVDPCGYPDVRRGRVEVPTAPGAGQPPDQAILEERGAQRRWFPATYT
jgi:O-succinylbenzoate synthase